MKFSQAALLVILAPLALALPAPQTDSGPTQPEPTGLPTPEELAINEAALADFAANYDSFVPETPPPPPPIPSDPTVDEKRDIHLGKRAYYWRNGRWAWCTPYRGYMVCT
ncbi:hypothetical protein QBC44DRAFT_405337 [Cladorrhinum sp. PSN332]|nr:hypothetical protein QBC44DRAFT_405337 [Cladorrhinum sp. PSN332]